jgi:hypothetical protein
MLNSFRISKNRITLWTLGITGFFLILLGTPLASYSIDYVDTNTTVYPYLAMGASLIILGFITMLVTIVNQRISLRQAQIIIGLSGQSLLGIVVFEIPLVPSLYYSPYNLHSYLMVLGVFGIALSLASIIMIGSYDKKKNPSSAVQPF